MSENLAKSSLTFSVMTFLSRVLGFIRDMVAAYIFGASPGYDAFVLSFRIPNLLRRLFAEGAFSQAFVPVLSEYQSTKPEHDVKAFINNITGNLAMVLAIVTLVGMLVAPLLIYLFAPGFEREGARHLMAVDMLRISFPYIFFISLTALAGSILNTHNKFAVPAFTPVLLNLCLIFASCIIAPKLPRPEIALAWGVLIAGIVQLGFQFPFLLKMGLLPKPKINWRDKSVRRVLLLMVPAIFGAAIGQITLLVNSLFASFLVAGSISWLYYADRLMEFPLGVVGVGIATVILPSMSRSHAKGDKDKFNRTLDWGVRTTVLIGIPAMLGLFMLAGPLVATLFHSGKFTSVDVLNTQNSLMAYALAVFGIMIGKIFSSAFYATQNIKTPVKIGAVILLVNIALNIILINKLAHVGLALATSITSLLNAGMLYYKWKSIHAFKFSPGIEKFLLQVTLASMAMIGFLLVFGQGLDSWLEMPRSFRVLNLTLLVAGGMLTYGATLFVAGIRPRQFALGAA